MDGDPVPIPMIDVPLIETSKLLAHQDFVRAVARRLIPDEHLAEDVVQDTWRAALTAKRPPQEGKERSWLARIAHNRALRELRTRSQRRQREERAAPKEALRPTDELVAELGASREIVDAVLRLDEPYRSTVIRRYYESMSIAEIARRTKVPESTVASRLRRAHELLRNRMGGDDPARFGAFIAGLHAVLDTHGSGEAAAAASTALAGKATLGGISLAGKKAGLSLALLLVGVGGWLFVNRALEPGEVAPPVEVGTRRDLTPGFPDGVAVFAAGPRVQREKTPVVVTPPAPMEELSELDRGEVASWRESTAPGVLAGIVRRGRDVVVEGRVYVKLGGSFSRLERPWRNTEGVLSSTLDAEGRFRFEGLEAGNWVVGYEPAHDAPVFEFWNTLNAGESGRSMVLVLGDARVEGQAFDSMGWPIHGAVIAISSRNGIGDAFHRFVTTKSDGGYALGDLPGGLYWWTCAPDGNHRYWLSNGHRSEPLSIAPDALEIVNQGRSSPLPVVKGTLEHIDGRAVKGPGRLLVLPEQGGYAETQLDADGSFELRIEPGVYRVQAKLESGDIWVDGTIEIGEDDATQRWKLAGARVRGLVTHMDASGARVPYPNVSIYIGMKDENEKWQRRTAKTDRDGGYELIGMTEGVWVAGAPMMMDRAPYAGHETLEVRASDVELHFDFDL